MTIFKRLLVVAVYVFTYRQEDLTWRRIVFLPFNFYWRIAVAIGGCIYFSLVLFEEVFLKTHANTSKYAKVLSIINVFYIVDIALSALHMVWEAVRKSMPYPPKPAFIMFIDILSILPLRSIMTNPILSDTGKFNYVKLWSLNSCLRIYRIYVEVFQLQQQIGVNPILICFIQQNSLIICMSAALCSVWYLIGYIFRLYPGSWLAELESQNPHIDMNNPTTAYIISLIYIYIRLNNEYTLNVIPINVFEMAFETATVYIGYLTRHCYSLSTMMASYLKYQGHMYTIKDHIAINKKITKSSRHKVLDEYYNTFWTNWLGLHKCPLFDIFPLCLQTDILTDEYWNAIDHSHVLRNFPNNMKRRLSLMMQSSFMQPGDYIYRKGQVRSSYYFIASGVVQIMSHYDGVSPIMTIASGSCLGGLSLVVPSPSPTDVICATECEVRCLTYSKFHYVLRRHMNGIQECHRVLKETMGYTKMIYVLSKAYRNEDPVMKLYGIPQDDKLKWIKMRWRTINNLFLDYRGSQLSEAGVHKIEEQYLPIEMTHTSKYLDLIVLSSEAKWDADKCCFKSMCSYVLEPNCNFVKMWHLFMVILVTIDCIALPYCAAYLSYTPEGMITWDQLLCFVYIFDMYVQIITAVRSVERTITEPTVLLRYHLKDLLVIIDLFATIPVRTISRILVEAEEDRVYIEYIGLNRLLKLVRVYTYFRHQCSLITAKPKLIYLVKYLYSFMMLSHILACVAFIMACSFKDDELECVEDSWYENFPKYEVFGMKKVLVYLISSLIYVGQLITNCGVTIVETKLLEDVLFTTVTIFLAKNIMMFTFSELMAMWNMRRRRKMACKELMDSLKNNLEQKGVHPGLMKILKCYQRLQWKVNYAVYQNLDSIPVSEIISPITKNENKKLITNSLKAIPFFASLEEDFFLAISSHFKLYTVPKDYIFCRSGEKPSCCNVILMGMCNQTSMMKEDVLDFPSGKIISTGTCFPLLEILQNIPCLQTTVSATVCSVIAINADLLKSRIFADQPMVYMIKRSIQLEMKDLDVVVSKMKYRKFVPKEPSFILRRSNKKTKENDKADGARYGSLLGKKCLRLWNRFWTPAHMVNPNGRFIYIWESVKVIQVIMSIIYLPFMYLFICEANTRFKFLFALFLDIFSLTDVYVRMNLGDYDTNGIIVNTKKQYLLHSFGVDLVSSLPFHLVIEIYDFTAKFMFLTFIKLLASYRIMGYIHAMKRMYGLSDFVTFMANFLIYIGLTMWVLASFGYIYTCTSFCDEGSYELDCRRENWLNSNAYFNNIENPLSLILSTFYATLSLLFNSDPGAFRPRNFAEIKALFFAATVTCIMKLYYLPRAAAFLIGGHLNFTKHREKMKQFNMFIKNEGGDKTIARNIIQHFVYGYNRSRGIKMRKFLFSIHPSILFDLTFAMYYNGTRSLHRFVGNDRYFMKMLSAYLEEVYYLKDSLIININEVNNHIFFINEGCVSTVDSEDRVLRQLKPGSMFGSFKAKGKCRHFYKYISQFNCCLLVIKTDSFLKLFRQYSKIDAAYFIKLTEGREFVSNKAASEMTMDFQMSVVKPHSVFYRGSVYYDVIMFILSMVIPYLTVFPLLLTIIFDEEDHSLNIIFLYVFDMVSYFRVLFGMNTTYTDKETGVYMSNLRRIRLQYLSNPLEFAIDVLGSFPLEVIGYVAVRRWSNWLRLNRMLRIVTMVNYLITHKATSDVNCWMRWFTFVINITLVPYIITVAWLLLMCTNGCRIDNDPDNVLTDPYDMFTYALNEIVILMTLSSSNAFNKPWSNVDCAFIIVIVWIAYICFPIIVASFTQKMEMSNYSKKAYEYKIYCMKLYLQLRDLSESLLLQLWNYSLLLWSSNRGEFMPKFVLKAPPNMRAELLYDLYGGHIKYNILFEECHHAFIFQLAGRLQRTVYFPGNFIIRKMDVDGRMYFINSGEVEAVEFDDLNMEIVKEVFITGQCFGLKQGLFDKQPHLITYKARNMVEILTLELSDFTDLMVAFPEEKEKIYKMAARMRLESVDW